MIEFVSSKVAGAVAAMVLLGSVLGFFSIQRASAEEQHFRAMCSSLAQTIDGVSSLNAATEVNVTFGQDGSGTRLDFSFRNKGYDIEIRKGQVIFRQGALTAVAPLARAIHPWHPEMAGNGTTLYVSEEALERFDREHPALKTPSGKDLVVESRLVAMSGEMLFRTFVHV